jgi:hypothetical protein
MPMDDEQKREVTQLMLVAREYLRLGNPPPEYEDTRMGESADALTGALDPPASAWERTLIGAHLGSAAIRLASTEAVLTKGGIARPVYTACLKYFSPRNPSPGVDARGETCSEWFHVMLRDAVCHQEPPEGEADRYAARQRCIEGATFAQAYERLQITMNDLLAVLRRLGITLPGPVRDSGGGDRDGT